MLTITAGPTQAETLRKLSEEEQAASAVPGFIALHEISVVGFISMGLELEETKCVLSLWSNDHTYSLRAQDAASRGCEEGDIKQSGWPL